MTIYTSFSKFYDTIMGDRTELIRLVRDRCHRYAPEAATLLELGCGTGSILSGLSPFYHVTGIDNSTKMLSIAQHKVPSATLICHDISRFELDGTFDIVICVFDTINHLIDYSLWEQTFERVYNHLGWDGIFMFDMLTPGRMKAETAMPTYKQDFGSDTLELSTTPLHIDAVTNSLTYAHDNGDGSIQMLEQIVDEAAFPLQTVTASLGRFFSIIEVFTPGGTAPSDASERIYVICQKRS